MKKLFIFFAAILAVSLFATELLPEAPKGFSWKQMPFIKAQILMPDEWFFSFVPDNKEDKYIYYISKENIEQKGFYETGFNMRVVRGVPSKTKGQLPSEYSASAVADTEKKVSFVKKWENAKGIFKEIGFIYNDAPEGKESITVHRLYISNDKTGTVYVLTFEGPTKGWNDLWRDVGEVMFKNLSIDESI